MQVIIYINNILNEMFSIDAFIFISRMVSISYLFDSFMILYPSEFLPVVVFQSEILFKNGIQSKVLFIERLRIKIAYYKTTKEPHDYLSLCLVSYKDILANCLRYFITWFLLNSTIEKYFYKFIKNILFLKISHNYVSTHV